jgi:hypothetical protein
MTDSTNLETLWGRSLRPVHCQNCEADHLIPANIKNALCPLCFHSNLDDNISLNRQEPAELIVEFMQTPDQIKENFKSWVHGIWFRPKELNPEVLASRLTKSFIPLWLVDGKVYGNWRAQMGFDYQVASTQEVYQNSQWITHELFETRTRWEPRIGKIDRQYQNITVPALENYTSLLNRLGTFDLGQTRNYSHHQLSRSSIRIPNITPEAAWSIAKIKFNKLAAIDCMQASDAQHFDEYNIEAEYSEKNWTQLLLPVYTSAYRDEAGKVFEIMVNGQNGKISGVKRASFPQARNLSLGLAGIALLCFSLGLIFAAGTTLLPILGVISLILFACTLFVGLIAPIPAIWAWNFNQNEASE